MQIIKFLTPQKKKKNLVKTSQIIGKVINQLIPDLFIE